MTDKLDIEAIKARVAAATSGPWWCLEDTYEGDEGWWVLGPKDGGVDEHHTLVALPYNPNAQVDAEFAAHSREDIPALLTAYEQLQARYEAAVEALRPFAEAATLFNESWRDTYGIGQMHSILVGHLRRAAAMVTQAERGQAQSEGEEQPNDR